MLANEIKRTDVLTASTSDDSMNVEEIDLSAMWADINRAKPLTNVDKLCMFVVNATCKSALRFGDPVAEKLLEECRTARKSSIYNHRGENGSGLFDDFCSAAKVAFLQMLPIDSPAEMLESISSNILESISSIGDGKHEEQKTLVNKMKNAVLSECRKMATRSRSNSLDALTEVKADKDATLDEENGLDFTDGEQENTLTAVEEQSHFDRLQTAIIERLSENGMKQSKLYAYKIFMSMPSATFETMAKIFARSTHGKDRTFGACLIFVKRTVHDGNEILRQLSTSERRSDRVKAIMCEKQ